MLYLIWSISFLVGIIASIGAKDKYGLFYNHYMVLNLWWHLYLFLSLFTIWNNSIYYNTYFIFFSGLFIFNLTIIFIPNYKATYRKRWGYINIRRRRLVEISVVILLIPFIRIFLDLISSGMELWMLRNFLRSDEGRRDYGSSVILMYFIVPVSVTLMITAYYKYYLYTKKCSNKVSLLISLLITIVLGLIDGGGRTLLFNWMLFYVYITICNSKKNHIYFNDNGKINIYIIALPVIGIMAMTILRGIFDISGGDVALNELFQANGLAIGLFDYYLKHPSVSGFTSNTFGLSSFENIFLLINYPFRLIFRNASYFIDYQSVDSIIQEFRLTESGLIGNAAVSMFFRFMRDWGYLGIFIGPMLLAWFVNKLYVLSLRDGFNFFLYLYTVLLLTNTTGELVFSKNSYLLGFIWFFVLKKFFLTKRKLNLL
jgi:oligosaccharide repeat unit polymerase